MSGSTQLPNIDKIFREDDDLDFTPVGSNLASIFGTPQKVQDVNSSLKYKPPKPATNGRNIPQAVPTSKIEVINAKAIHAFKLENGQYVSTGKLGIALTGNASTKQYQIILYRGKQDHVSIVTITHDFCYTVQANNYSSYYDSRKENWSILFDSREASIEFAREIALSRYFCKQGKSDGAVTYQDLTAVEKDVVAKEGDHITLKYMTAVDIVQPLKIDSVAMQTMTLELSKDDNWERLLVGTSKGLRRIMILPSNKQIGLGPGFPKDKDVAMEFEILSITAQEEQAAATALKSVPSGGKASILSRMARMGQSILPKVPASTTTDSDETEDEVYQKSPRHKRVFMNQIPTKAESVGSPLQKKQFHANQQPESQTLINAVKPVELAPTTVSIAHRPLVSATAFAPQWQQNQIPTQYVTIDGQLYPVQQQTMAQPIPATIDPSLNVFLSESRTQNAEVRMGISKIADNVQRLLDKFHVLELQNLSTSTTDKTTEATLRMLLEMNKANRDIDSKNSETQCVVEKREMSPTDRNLIAVNQELSDKITCLENELKEVKDLINDKAKYIGDMEEENRKLQRSNAEQHNRIVELEKSLAETNGKFEEAFKSSQQLKVLEATHEKHTSELLQQISEFTVECEDLKKANEIAKIANTNESGEKTREVKRIMNEAYQKLQACFTDDSYSTDFIRATIASTIRNVTLKVLDEGRSRDEEPAGTGNSMKVNETKTSQKVELETRNTSEDTALTLPDVTASATKGSTIPVNRDEPPPIPPMDLDANEEW